MSHQTVLISSLGESPAVVTEAIDKLEQEERIKFTQVVTLGTNEYEVRRSANVLYEHIPAYYGSRVTYYHEAISANDVDTKENNLDYLALVAEKLRAFRRYSDVYVSIAGGRKTMSALVALAVQIYGAKLLCHIVYLLMDETLQRDMLAGNLIRNPQKWDSLLHPNLDEVQLVRLPVISLFPLINDFLSALGGRNPDEIDRTARQLLEENGLLGKENNYWHTTKMGEQLYQIINDIEMLPEPSTIAPQNKKVDLKDHHGKDELRPIAELLRFFPYAQRIDSTDWNSQFDRSRTLRTPHGRLLVEIDSADRDLLLVTLADSSRGYRLAVRTLAQSKSQAERVKREMERFLRREM
jgi:CRISPR-associated protein Csx14